jgi:hypothetical protein
MIVLNSVISYFVLKDKIKGTKRYTAMKITYGHLKKLTKSNIN